MAKKGYKMTEEHKRKISESHKALEVKHWSHRPEVKAKLIKTLRSDNWLGKKRPDMAVLFKGKKRPEISGTKNNNWKGADVGYHALHVWLRRHLGKAKVCSECGSKKNVHWANISFEYKREFSDYRALCAKCHRIYDYYNGWGLATKKFNLNAI